MENTHLGADGLLYCNKCGKKRQTFVNMPLLDGSGKRQMTKVNCICDCMKKADAETQKRFKHMDDMKAIETLKRMSLMDERLSKAAFSAYKPNENNMKAYRMARKYTERFPEMMKQHQGLIFYGPVGTGKSYTAACIANELLAMKYSVIMTSFIKLLQEMMKIKSDQNIDYVERLNIADLLIIDDLGAERSTDYALENVYNVIDSRYRSGKPIILTTNLDFIEMKNEEDIRFTRIYDRIFEMCYPVKLSGVSFRRMEASERFRNMEDMMN